jgi:hypothetical protein
VAAVRNPCLTAAIATLPGSRCSPAPSLERRYFSCRKLSQSKHALVLERGIGFFGNPIGDGQASVRKNPFGVAALKHNEINAFRARFCRAQ